MTALAALALTFTMRLAVVQPAGRNTAGPAPATGLVGTWVGLAAHAGETRTLALRLEAAEGGTVRARMSTPSVNVWDVPIGPATIDGDRVAIGPFSLTYDRTADTLTAVIPAAVVPVYTMTVTYHRSPALERPPRSDPAAPIAPAVWTFDAGAPVWADVSFADGVLYVAADDGRLHALDSRTGRRRWSFATGGALRARPVRDGDAVFVQSDDGFLYRVGAADGRQRWRVRIAEKPIVRLPFDDPRSRYDYRASAVTVSGGRLYLGTHAGHVLALDASSGAPRWDFAARDSVLATPVVDAGSVYFGSYDGCVYAVDAASGALRWKHDTGAPVVSTPAPYRGRVIVGSRSYDLLALDEASGRPAWTRYIWFSWVESPATVKGDVVYVGSSDAARLFAFDGESGGPIWDVDAGGWAWGQPAVTPTRVYIGTGGTAHYMAEQRGGVLAVDRAGGRPVWRHPAAPSEAPQFGFAGSPAVGDGLVYFGGLDGRVYAFRQ